MKFNGRNDFLQCFKRSSSRTKDQRRIGTQVKNGGFHPNVGSTTVENCVYPSVEIVKNMFCRRWARLSCKVGARSSNGTTAFLNQHQCHFMLRHPYGYSIQTRNCHTR